MTEYHGWIVLCSSDPDWSDDEWHSVHGRLAGELLLLLPEDGHSVGFVEPANAMKTIFLHGYIESGIEAVTQLFLTAVDAAPDSYGELLVLNDEFQTFRTAHRYRLDAGTFHQVVCHDDSV